MTLSRYLGILRSRWQVIVAILLISVISGLGVALTRQAQYSAEVTLYVAAQTTDSTNSAYQGSLLSQQRVKSYTDLVTSPRVVQDAITKGQLDSDRTTLARQLSASNPPDSVLINIIATDPNPQRAAFIADSVSTSFVALVDDIERPRQPGAVQPVAVRIVQPASVPNAPSSISRTQIVAIAALLGLALGVVGALARDLFDTTLRAESQLREALNRSTLGTTWREEVFQNESSVVEAPLTPEYLESLRRIRTNLRFINVDDPPRTILFSSAVSGEGKSTTVSLLAIALASAGSSVVVVDADLRRPSIAKNFGVDNAAGLSTILSGRITWRQAIQTTSLGGPNVIASGPCPPNPSELLGSNRMSALLDELKNTFDYVLVDTPPILPVSDAAVLASSADGVLLVCKYGSTSTVQISQTAQSLHDVSAVILGSILSMAPKSSREGQMRYGHYYGSGDDDSDLTSVNGFDKQRVETTPRPSPRPRYQSSR